MKTLKVANHWFNDSGNVEIVLLVPLDKSIELWNDLFWYDGNNRPLWSRGTELTDKEVLGTHCYKQRKMYASDYYYDWKVFENSYKAGDLLAYEDKVYRIIKHGGKYDLVNTNANTWKVVVDNIDEKNLGEVIS